MTTVAALSTVYPEARNIHDPANRLLQIKWLIGKMPSIAAMSYRHSLGFPYVYPDNDLSYPENFMNMLWKMVEPKYAANPVIARALDILFILHADHEQNCSTNAMRSVGRTVPFRSQALGPLTLLRHGALSLVSKNRHVHPEKILHSGRAGGAPTYLATECCSRHPTRREILPA
jgi:hypothetical protein